MCDVVSASFNIIVPFLRRDSVYSFLKTIYPGLNVILEIGLSSLSSPWTTVSLYLGASSLSLCLIYLLFGHTVILLECKPFNPICFCEAIFSHLTF